MALSLPYFHREGYAADPSDTGRAYLASIVTMAAGSVDRLEEVPSRLRFLFEFDPRKALSEAKKAARGIVKVRLEAFGCAGHAPNIKPIPLEAMAKRYQ